jgi:hypothetical protein
MCRTLRLSPRVFSRPASGGTIAPSTSACCWLSQEVSARRRAAQRNRRRQNGFSWIGLFACGEPSSTQGCSPATRGREHADGLDAPYVLAPHAHPRCQPRSAGVSLPVSRARNRLLRMRLPFASGSTPGKGLMSSSRSLPRLWLGAETALAPPFRTMLRGHSEGPVRNSQPQWAGGPLLPSCAVEPQPGRRISPGQLQPR